MLLLQIEEYRHLQREKFQHNASGRDCMSGYGKDSLTNASSQLKSMYKVEYCLILLYPMVHSVNICYPGFGRVLPFGLSVQCFGAISSLVIMSSCKTDLQES